LMKPLGSRLPTEGCRLSTHPVAGGLMKPIKTLSPLQSPSYPFNPPCCGRVDETEMWGQAFQRLALTFNPPCCGRVDETPELPPAPDKLPTFNPPCCGRVDETKRPFIRVNNSRRNFQPTLLREG